MRVMAMSIVRAPISGVTMRVVGVMLQRGQLCLKHPNRTSISNIPCSIPLHQSSKTAQEANTDTTNGHPCSRLAVSRILAPVAEEDLNRKPQEGQQPRNHQQLFQRIADHRYSRKNSDHIPNMNQQQVSPSAYSRDQRQLSDGCCRSSEQLPMQQPLPQPQEL